MTMGSDQGRREDPLILVEALFSGANAGRLFGEAVSIGEHMRQTAALAELDRAAPTLVVAALLHDVAYVVAPDPSDARSIEIDHAEIGGAWLERWFPETVSEPVRLHVEAKRYLTLTESGYAAMLSPESLRTFELQGGVMTRNEARQFESVPHFEDAVRLRRWDEQAKDPSAPFPEIEHFRDL
ncbi:MAG TPA: HD domain-containing protein, partial [Acidimicrobiales bacterium]|nr:HD domain-containing protein [Acidimicrobiales bacterium]